MFDKDRSGFASSSEIKTVMANLGVHFSDEEIQEMMIEVEILISKLGFIFFRRMLMEITKWISMSSKP